MWLLVSVLNERQKGRSILDVIHNEEFDEDNSDFIKDYFINKNTNFISILI